MLWREVFTVWVPGIPAPQGSKAYKGKRKNGSAILIESHRGVKPWRAAIVQHCSSLVPQPLDTYVRVRAAFYFPRPKTVKTLFPIGNEGDIDKLLRSTYDGLKTAGVVRDDRLFTDGSQIRRFAEAGQLSGAWLRIEVLPDYWPGYEYREAKVNV